MLGILPGLSGLTTGFAVTMITIQATHLFKSLLLSYMLQDSAWLGSGTLDLKGESHIEPTVRTQLGQHFTIASITSLPITS